ncbi:MAG: hypothetical protein LBG72_08040 [Spirochaetaceae bacterium]|jgi:hypothetical protein|nr:hypothetical protein [Spirochaetaceae bacterium]
MKKKMAFSLSPFNSGHVSNRGGGGVIKKLSHAFTLAVLLCVSAVIFSSCETDGGDDGGNGIIGLWVHNYSNEHGDGTSEFTVSAKTFHYGDPAYPDYDVNGSIEYHTDLKAESGIIFFKITSSSNNGKYTVAFWKNLTGSTVEMSTAYQATSEDDFSDAAPVDSLDDAKQKFTLDNADTFVSQWGGPYTKQ